MRTMCAICQNEIHESEAATACNACRSPFHRECWTENGGCATYGCLNVPLAAQKSETLERSFWGKREKTCPYCGETIDVSAYSCHFCKETFETTDPLNADDIRKTAVADPQADAFKKHAVLLLACGISGILAPIVLIVGGIWFGRNRKVLAEKTPLHRLLALAGLGISAFYMLLMLMGIVFF
jgi:hypothetical protein